MKEKNSLAKDKVCQILALAGIEVNGNRPEDIQIHDEHFYERVLSHPSLGLGESYMDGWWDCQRIDEMITKILKLDVYDKITLHPKLFIQVLLNRLFNFQTKARAKEVADKHYNIGNKLYRAMLDEEMNYSCGYWKKAHNLDEAQRDKMELICQKLMLKPGMKVLDIGCGWGGFAKYAAEHYQVEITGVTISPEQKKFAEEHCKGLPVAILLKDYREMEKKPYDRVVSIGMFEHVGYKNYRRYMKIVSDCLEDGGIFLLHTIGTNLSYYNGDPWLHKYIFPNGMLPSPVHIGQAIEGVFVLEDWHNFSTYYDQTLLAWHQNFNQHWPELKKEDPSYNERFFRMWNYYLLCCAAGFRARRSQLWQIVLSKQGVPGGYHYRDLTGVLDGCSRRNS